MRKVLTTKHLRVKDREPVSHICIVITRLSHKPLKSPPICCSGSFYLAALHLLDII